MSHSTYMNFGHIRRMTDSRFPHQIAVIMPGEYFVSEEPMIVYTVLGSCISVCIRDPLLGVGGMNHFMLSVPKENGQLNSWGESARYGTFAMEVLINEILKRGGRKNRLETKVFGGGRITRGMSDVGAQNAAWAMDFLDREGLAPLKVDVGDVCPRKVYFFTQSGRVLLKRLGQLQGQAIAREEQQYQNTLTQQALESDVTLF